ncbi:hypothetical protein [Dactylosporangium sp. CA-139066]|uniref:hypothetical protein n=1 Tax=Dactylosporangium sp. CA-139066 TaxID=3239930 RepID=UPI003D8B79B3
MIPRQWDGRSLPNRPGGGVGSEGVWAEIHVFRGRMYVTGTWGTSTGEFVRDRASDRRLGKTIMRLAGQQAQCRPPGRRTPWHDFCEREAGVPVRQFRPEKRLRALRTAGGWQVDRRPGHHPESVWTVPDSAGPAGLAAVVRRELAAMEPQWPAVRRVMIMTMATGQLVVVPNIDGYDVGPARILAPDGGTDAVRAALGDAGGERAEAADLGVDPQLLKGRARVIFDERSDGSVELTGDDHRKWHGRIDALDEACAAAVRMISQLPTRHLPPGTPGGAGFGFKCCWLAVKGATLDEVAAAVGLVDRRAVTWDEGVDLAYRQQVFVSPPTGGWVFVVGNRLPFDGRAVAGLSDRLKTEVQFFGTHRVSDYHEWALARDGRLRRRVHGEGIDFEEEGARTPVEAGLDLESIYEGDVMEVAGAWSIDPQTLDVVEASAPTGLAGRIPER